MTQEKHKATNVIKKTDKSKSKSHKSDIMANTTPNSIISIYKPIKLVKLNKKYNSLKTRSKVIFLSV